MSEILVVWYALGWASAGILAHDFDELTLVELICALAGGPIAFVPYAIGHIIHHRPRPVILWRAKP